MGVDGDGGGRDDGGTKSCSGDTGAAAGGGAEAEQVQEQEHREQKSCQFFCLVDAWAFQTHKTSAANLSPNVFQSPHPRVIHRGLFGIHFRRTIVAV